MARKTEIRYINCYTAGSAACKLDFSPVQKDVKLPKQRKKKKLVICVDPIAVTGILVACVMFVLMIAGVCRLADTQKQAQQMSAYVQRLEEENVQLRATYEAGYDLEEIRQIAEAKGMIPISQAETIYIPAAPPAPQPEPTFWDNVLTFLSGFFA